MAGRCRPLRYGGYLTGSEECFRKRLGGGSWLILEKGWHVDLAHVSPEQEDLNCSRLLVKPHTHEEARLFRQGVDHLPPELDHLFLESHFDRHLVADLGRLIPYNGELHSAG